MAWPRGALLLVAGALAAVWYLFEHSRDRASSFEAPAVGTTVAAAAASGWFAEDAGGCLVPRRIGGG